MIHFIPRASNYHIYIGSDGWLNVHIKSIINIDDYIILEGTKYRVASVPYIRNSAYIPGFTFYMLTFTTDLKLNEKKIKRSRKRSTAK